MPLCRAQRQVFVVGEIAILDEKMRRCALEVIDDRLAILRDVVGMDAPAGFLRRQRLILGHAEDRAQQRRVIDGVVDDIPVVDAVIDRFQRERVALFVCRSRLRRARGARRRVLPPFSLSRCSLHPGGLIFLSLPFAARRIVGPGCIVRRIATGRICIVCIATSAHPPLLRRNSRRACAFPFCQRQESVTPDLARGLRLDQVPKIEHAIDHGQI